MKLNLSALRGRLKPEKAAAFFKSLGRDRFLLLLGIAATAAVVVLAAVLPAAFLPPKNSSTAETPAAPGARAALFNRFWNEDALCEVMTVERSAFSEEELAPSGERIRALHETFHFDDATPLPESSGEHFYILRGADGVTLRMREFYEQSEGDWNTWFRVFTDIDAEEIYFFYQSCKCLHNAGDYDFSDLNAQTLSEEWKDALGADECLFTPGAGTLSHGVYVSGGQALYYDLSYTSYTEPEHVEDFRFVMKPPPEG